MRKIGVISIIILAIGFITYLYFTDKHIKDKVAAAELSLRSNMESAFRRYHEAIEKKEAELQERLAIEKEELDQRLTDHAAYFITPSQEDYTEIRNEITRYSDAFRAFDDRIAQFKRALPMDKSTRDTEELYNKILVVLQAHRDYYNCLIQIAPEQEMLEERLKQALNNLQRRRRLDIPEIDEDYVPCRDDKFTYDNARQDVLEYLVELRRRPITF